MKDLELKLSGFDYNLLMHHDVQTIDAVLDNVKIGYIQISSRENGISAHIDQVVIEDFSKYKELYRILLKSVFQIANYSRLISDCRTDFENDILKSFINKEIDNNDVVLMTIDYVDKLHFELKKAII